MSLGLRVVFLACVISVIELAAGIISIAPGDEERELCKRLRSMGVAPTPGYAPNMRVLMDSWNYRNLLPVRTGDVWDQVDNDNRNNASITTNWIQQSNTPCQQSVQVCGFIAGPQSNWLLTQLINRTVDGSLLSQVNVQIEFELQNCDVTLNCQRTFNTHVYETSLASDAARRNIQNYRQVQRVSPDITTGARVNKTVVVTFETNEPFFYFAIEDERTCIVMTRMIVFYNICLSQIIDLVSAPEVIAPATGFAEVEGSCASNAVTEDGDAPKLICSPDGTWIVLGSGCRCAPGSDFENGSCSLPPPPPKNIHLYVTSDNSIYVTWDPPATTPSDHPLTYSVYIALDGGERFPVVEGINATNYAIMNLLPGRMYTVFVITSTSFTGQLPDDVFSAFSVSDKTTTSGSSAGTVAKSFSSSEIAVAAIIPSLFALFLLLGWITVIIVFVYKQQINKQISNNSADGDKAYYSTIGPPSPQDLNIEGNVAYEEVHCKPTKPNDSGSDVQKNIAYGVCVH